MPENDKPEQNNPAVPAQVKPIDVQDLLQGGREAILIHAGEVYRLRVTAKGKLILTK